MWREALRRPPRTDFIRAKLRCANTAISFDAPGGGGLYWRGSRVALCPRGPISPRPAIGCACTAFVHGCAPRMAAPCSSGGARRDATALLSRPVRYDRTPVDGAGQPGMRRDQRLRRAEDFAQVQRRGRAWSNDLLVLRALRNELGITRYGFPVSRRVGKAVVRNLAKRRLREIVRREPVAPGWDLVLIARASIAQAPFPDIQGAVRDLLRRGRLLESAPGGDERRGQQQ